MAEVEFIIIKDSFGERITATLETTNFYLNNSISKTEYKKIRKLIGSYNKTLALLNIRSSSKQIQEVASMILYGKPYKIKYIDFTVIPNEIKHRHYDGKSFS